MATTQSVNEFKPKQYFERLFNWIPTVLNDMIYPNIPMNEGKLFRLEILNSIYNKGIEEYYNTINENTPDFYCSLDGSEKIYLVDFQTESELREWVISGMSKKEQDLFFIESSEEDSCDSFS